MHCCQKPRLNWLRRKLRRWLGIENLTTLSFEADQRLMDSIYSVVDQIQTIKNQSFMGVDLDHHEGTQIILLTHSPHGDGWKVIADTKLGRKSQTYHELVRHLRGYVKEHNVRYFASDEPSDCPSLSQRVLPGTNTGCFVSDPQFRKPALFARSSIAHLYSNFLNHNGDCPTQISQELEAMHG